MRRAASRSPAASAGQAAAHEADPYGTFRLDMDKRLDLVPLAVLRAGTPSDASALVWAGAARTSCPSDSTIIAAAALITAGVSCRRGTGW
jgi:hypothetical protein